VRRILIVLGILCVASTIPLKTMSHAGAAVHTSLPWCTESELNVSADWQGVNTTRIGGVRFAVRGRKTCRLRGHPDVAVIAGGHRLKVRERQVRADALFGDSQDGSGRTVVVGPGHPAGAGFDWSNWCGRQFRSPMRLSIGLPNQQRQSLTYVRYGVASRSATTPYCLSSSAPSVIAVGFIRAVTSADPLP
jgi:hypothetical protein